MGKIQATRVRSMQEDNTTLRVEQCHQLTIGISSLPTTNPYYCGLTTIALEANWFAAKLRMCIWCISMYINIDICVCIYIYIHIYIYIYVCVCDVYTGTRLYYHPQNFTWLRLHKWKWSGIADLLRTYSKHVRQATLDSMWCMNMSTSKIQCKTQYSSSPWNHNVFILKTYILYRCHHPDITMSAKRITTKKESN